MDTIRNSYRLFDERSNCTRSSVIRGKILLRTPEHVKCASLPLYTGKLVAHESTRSDQIQREEPGSRVFSSSGSAADGGFNYAIIQYSGL